MAKAVSQRINQSGVLWCSERPDRDVLRARLIDLLSTPLHFDDSYRRYRFPRSRAEQIADGFCTVYNEFGSLGQFLDCYSDAPSARAWMVMHIQGVGPKQASMFLRNGTRSYDLAIIDRYVLRYMQLIKLCGPSESDVSTVGKYERHEIRLQQYATSMGYSVGLLDWAI